MLSLRVRPLMVGKGLRAPMKWLRKFGFSHHRAWQLLRNQASEIKLGQLELLCFFLRCTPNDLFLYTPGKPWGGLTDEVPPPDHPLHTLARDAGKLSLAERMMSMSQPQIHELTKLLDEMERKKKEGQG